MKKLLVAVSIIAVGSPALAAAPSALAAGGGVNTAQYHSYDGLICTDCHTLHASENGAAVSAGAGAGNWAGFDDLVVGGGYRELLKKGDWTDMCLSCHKQGFNTSSTVDLPGVTDSGWVAPIVMTTTGTIPAGVSMPAGDFYWSATYPARGHNPAFTKGSMGAATSKLMTADPVLASNPPGGAITDGEWSCHSCHGMHSRFSGSYTAYRQLKRTVNGILTTGRSQTAAAGVETFAGTENTAAGYEAILSNSRGDIQGTAYVNTRADGRALQGADLYVDYSDTNKNVYQGGFSSFCSACHGNFHGTATTEGGTDNTQTAGVWVKHPTNLEMGPVSGTRKYGITTYRATVTNAQGNNPNPVGYDWKYPLVKAGNDFTVLGTVASAADNTTLANTDRIMCLTCHRAHASEFENMTRWDTNAHAFIANGATDFEGDASIGDNPAYGCGKCHQKGGTNAYVKGF